MFPVGAVPVDRYSVQVMAAVEYLRRERDSALDKARKLKESEQQGVWRKFPTEKDKPVRDVELDQAKNRYNDRADAVERVFHEKEQKVLLKAAGPYAKMIH